MNMAGGVLSGSGEVIEPKPEDPTGPITSVGEVKKSDPKDSKEPPKKEEKPEPDPEPTPEPIGQVTQEYFRGVAIADILPPSAWVLDFPGPYREYAPPESNSEDFVGRVCMETIGVGADDWAAADYIAPISGAIVTITDGPRAGERVVTNEGGYFLFRDVPGNELYLRVERQYLEPKEVIAFRNRPTMLQQLRPNEVFNAAYQEREGLSNAPGVILMGLRWPNAVRFILETEKLPYGLLYGIGDRSPDPVLARGGFYGGLHIALYHSSEDKGRLSYKTLMHELAHARQHAVAMLHGYDHWRTLSWNNTPEARAYKAAWERDLEEIPHKDWLGTLDKSDYYESNLLENAAEFCAMYWKLETGMTGEETLNGGIQKRAPNRFKWCQKYLANQYD